MRLPSLLVAALLLAASPAFPAPSSAASVVLRWRPVDGAAAYELEISSDRGFASVVKRERVEGAGYRWNELPTSTFYWRVRSIDAEGRRGKWSDPLAIARAVQPPAVVVPAAGSKVRTGEPGRALTLSAEPNPVLAKFVFQLARDERFAEGVTEVEAPASARAELPMPEPGSWFVRARGVDVDGRPTEFSAPRKFTVALSAPRLLAPAANGSIPLAGNPPAIAVSVGPVAHARGYLVELGLEGAAPRRQPFAQPPTSLPVQGPGIYRWRAAAVGADGVPGDFSAAQSFTVTAPAPVLAALPLTPVNERGERQVSFAFEGPTGARYLLEVAHDEAFADKVASVELPASPGMLTVAPGSYLARVTASFDGASVASTPVRFEVAAPAPAPAPVVQPVRAEVALLRSSGDEIEFEFSLLDRQGALLDGLTPSVRAAGLEVRALSNHAGHHRVQARVSGAPEQVPLEIEAAGARLLAQLVLPARPTRWTFGARFGVANNYAAVTAPSLALEATFRTPLLSDRLSASARLGWLTTGMAFPAALGLPAELTAKATVVPVSLLALYGHTLGGFELYAGAGPQLAWAGVSVGRERESALVPGVVGLLGAAHPLGRGAVNLELQLSTGRFDGGLARLGVGGIGFTVGYRFGR